MKKFREELIRYVDAGFPIIYVPTLEEEKVTRIIYDSFQDTEIMEWNIRGLIDRRSHSVLLDYALADSLEMLLKDVKLGERKLILLRGYQYFADEPNVIERLKMIAQLINDGTIRDCRIIIISPMLKIKPELEPYVTVLKLEYLTEQEIKELIVDFISTYELPLPEAAFLDEMAIMFKGLKEIEIYNILSLALSEDRELNRADFSLIFEHKQQLIRKSGIIEMVLVGSRIEDIGGLENLKMWLTRKSRIMKNITQARNFGVDIPKGVLIVGMPGCGKSLSAKATATLFDVPLLRLDMGRLMGKYVGESESNLRQAISLSEACSPCVLWIDELEKAFAGIGNQGNSEVTTRLFGNFLTWLQEKDSLTFVVATANNIAVLPPELLRKGRFDEIFYVSLPTKKERHKIFQIHISKRRPQDLSNINIDQLVEKTDGFSGADIEGVVKDTIEQVFYLGRTHITTEDFLKTIEISNSLADTLKDSLDKLSQFYKEHKFKSAS